MSGPLRTVLPPGTASCEWPEFGDPVLLGACGEEGLYEWQLTANDCERLRLGILRAMTMRVCPRHDDAILRALKPRLYHRRGPRANAGAAGPPSSE